MTPDEFTTALQRLMAAHGIATTERDGWLRGEYGHPALRAIWHPGPWPENPGQLDIQVALQDGRVIEECFVGIGEEPEGCRDAVRHFIMSSFHVLLAALWRHPGDEQVAVEDWVVGAETWKAYIGDFVRRFSHADVEPPLNAFEAIAQAAKREKLPPGVHWIRTYFSDPGNGETIIETLLDNEIWDAGAEAYAALPWPTEKGFYSVRNFLILDVASPLSQGTS